MTLQDHRTRLKHSQQLRDILCDLFDALSAAALRVQEVDRSLAQRQQVAEFIAAAIDNVQTETQELNETDEDTHRQLTKSMKAGV